MATTIHNFNPGPAIMPQAVLREAQTELLDYHGIGISILEASHRAPEYEAINAEAQATLKRLLGLGELGPELGRRPRGSELGFELLERGDERLGHELTAEVAEAARGRRLGPRRAEHHGFTPLGRRRHRR